MEEEQGGVPMKRAAIVLTTGFEEIEAIAPMDILRRAGVEVDIVGVDAKVATGSHNLTISTDKELVEVMNDLYDIVILPGGMPGAKLLKDHQAVQEFVKLHCDAGKIVAANCAAPIAIENSGALKNRTYTCYPGFEKQIVEGTYTGEFVHQDGRVITGSGPAAAFEFSYIIVEALGIDSAPLREAMGYNRLLK